jgi:hypothetical protein
VWLLRFKVKHGLRNERDWKQDVGDGALNRSNQQPLSLHGFNTIDIRLCNRKISGEIAAI